MKKKQDLITFNKLATKKLFETLEKLQSELRNIKIAIATQKNSNTGKVKILKKQIAQIKTLINQRILEEIK
ncbi:MAG: hypothetical protein CEN89_64 [Candidatus Berkelbacteria bacterium Licking1014_7]|uniref:Large ribosomal subunit protein uL29 n=1 Tax=Candidatus Berkelbacteria bacterium Licking1014_7 TaxID=2017147 RepID=A0A554LL71_9BACT|nr:MAG: hypothetical protein CEN89_64 [Candidatus Berkelbacteria bacterium Licking1014_7]